MKFRTKKGIIEVSEVSEGYFQITNENGIGAVGAFVFCNPVPTDSSHMDIVKDPVHSIMLFWDKENKDPYPTFISEEIIEVVE